MRFVNVAIVANIQLGIVHWNWIHSSDTSPTAVCLQSAKWVCYTSRHEPDSHIPCLGGILFSCADVAVPHMR